MDDVVIQVDQITQDVIVTVNQQVIDTTIQVTVLQEGLQGPPGPARNGISAYQTWLNLGNVGTEQDFINSLRPFNITIGPTQPLNPQVNDLWIKTS